MKNITLISNQNGIYSFEIDTGVVSQSFRDTLSSKFGVSYIGRATNYLASFQTNKSLLHIWNNKSEPIYKVSLPEIIKSCTFQEDGGILYAGGSSGTIYIWLLSTGQLLNCWLSHYKSVNKIDLIRNSSILVTCSDDCYVQAFLVSDILESNLTLNTPKPIMRWQVHSASVNDFISLSTTSDFSKLLVVSVGSDYVVNFLTFQNERPLHSLNISTQLLSCAASECCSQLFIGGGNGKIYRIFIDRIKKLSREDISILTGHTGSVRTCKCFNNRLFSSAIDGVRIWDINTGTCITRISQFGSSIISILPNQLPCIYSRLLLPPFKPFQKNISDFKKIFGINIITEDRRQLIKQDIYVSSGKMDYNSYFRSSLSTYLDLKQNLRIQKYTKNGDAVQENLSDTIIKKTIERCISLDSFRTKLSFRTLSRGLHQSKSLERNFVPFPKHNIVQGKDRRKKKVETNKKSKKMIRLKSIFFFKKLNKISTFRLIGIFSKYQCNRSKLNRQLTSGRGPWASVA